MHAHVCACLHEFMRIKCYRGQKRTSNTLELELQMVGSSWVLATELRSSVRRTNNFKCWTTSPVSHFCGLITYGHGIITVQCRRTLELENNTVYCISNVIDVKTQGKLNIGDTEMKLLKTCNRVWSHMPVIPIFGGERPSLRPGSTALWDRIQSDLPDALSQNQSQVKHLIDWDV